MVRNSRLAIVLAAVLVAFAVAAPQAAASSVSYVLNIDHCGSTCGSIPFGTVTLTQNLADIVMVDVDLNWGDRFVKTGVGEGDTFFAFNLDGISSAALSGLSDARFSLYHPSSRFQFDGFGQFEYGIACVDCRNGANGINTGHLAFTVQASGLTLDSFRETSTGNGSDHVYFAADIIGSNGMTGAVGAVDTTTTTTVPEPASMMLIGSGLLGAGFFARRRKK